MSRYGINYYNLAFYGPDNAAQFITSSFTAQPIDYGYIQINWNSPAGTWSRLRLVRNSFGHPVSPWDGEVLVESFIETDPTEYEDRFKLSQGSYYYYSLFVFEINTYTWVRVGDAIGLSVKNYGYADKLYQMLPDIYKINTIYDAATNYDNNDLYRFISIFGFELDYTYTAIHLLNKRYDIQKCNGSLIPLFLKQFGYVYEKEMGYQQARILVRDALQIQKEKGSAAGLREFIKAFGGYAVPKPLTTTPNPSLNGLTNSHNIMLDHNDSSFEEGIGHWGSNNATGTLVSLQEEVVKQISIASNTVKLVIGPHGYRIGNKITISGSPLNVTNSASEKTITARDATSVSYTISGAIADVVLQGAFNKTSNAYPIMRSVPAPWVEPTAPVLTPNKKKGILAVSSTSGSTADVKFECGLSNPLLKGIPVTGGLNYTFSGYTITGGTARSVFLGCRWYTRLGAFLSESVGSGSNNATGEFVSGSRRTVTDTAPATAAYAVPTVTVLSMGGSEFHYFDAFQFEQSNSATDFDEARQIHLTIKASRINELKNPNFAQTGSGPITVNPWKVTGGTIAVNTSSQQPGAIVYSVIRKRVDNSVGWVTFNVTHDYRVGNKVAISGMGSPWDGVKTLIADTDSSAGTAKRISFALSTANLATVDATGSAFYAGDALQITATGTSVATESWDGSNTSQLMPIHYPDTDYTFSVYAQGMGATNTVTPFIKWYTIGNTQIGSTVNGRAARLTASITDVFGDGEFVTYKALNNFVVGQLVTISGITMIDGPTYNLANVRIVSVTEDQFVIASGANGRYQTGGTATPTTTAGDWIRPYVTATAPSTAAYAVVGVTWATTTSSVIRYDSALFEDTAGVFEFFSGNDGPATQADLYWEGGAVNAGRSHLYKNRFALINRLISNGIPDQLIPNTPVSVYLAQPQT